MAMKAMGIESDQEIIQYIGPEPALLPVLLPTLQECKQMEIFTQQQALDYMGDDSACTRYSIPQGSQLKVPKWEVDPALMAFPAFSRNMKAERHSLGESCGRTRVAFDALKGLRKLGGAGIGAGHLVMFYFRLPAAAGSKVKQSRTEFGTVRKRKAPADEARDLLINMVFTHIPVVQFNYEEKVTHFLRSDWSRTVFPRQACGGRSHRAVLDREDTV